MRKKKLGFSIRKQMLLTYFLIVALILLVGFMGIFYIRRVYRNGNALYAQNLKSVEYLKSISQNVKEIDQSVVVQMGSLRDVYHSTYREEVKRLQQENQELMKSYEKIKVSKLEKRRYKQCRLSILTLNKQFDSILAKLEEEDSGTARKMEQIKTTYEQELMPVKACTYDLIDIVVDLSTRNASAKIEENHKVYYNLTWIIIIVMILSVFCAIVVTIKMSNRFTRKLEQIQNLALRISEYNLSGDIEYTGDDEFGETMVALNESQFMLRDLLEKITDESASIDDIGNEVADAVHKSKQKIDTVNLDLYKVTDVIEDVRKLSQDYIYDAEKTEDLMLMLAQVIQECDSGDDWIKEMQTSLAGIATYLEQVEITAKYQNEIAGKHRVQVERFQVSRDEAEDEPEETVVE